MRTAGSLLVHIAVCFILCSCTGGNKDSVSIDNGLVCLAFDSRDGHLTSLRSLPEHYEMLDRSISAGLPWAMTDYDGKPVTDTSGFSFSIQKKSAVCAVLRWKMKDGVRVKAIVRLDRNERMSYWTASVSGVRGKCLEKLQLPIIRGLKKLPGEKMALPSWQGSLFENPREGICETDPVCRYEMECPGHHNIQMSVIYGENCPGLFFGSRDPGYSSKEFEIRMDSTHTEYIMTHISPKDSIADSFEPGYEAVVGLFDGDWIDAAGLYRKWAVKQDWCINSRFKTGKTARWARETDLWIWNRNSASNAINEAEDAKDFMGDMNVSLLWHWWHGCPYDDGFPDYIPPRDGIGNFKDAIAGAREKGINTLVYMNTFQWGNSAASWEKENPGPYRALKADGSDYSRIYNRFTLHKLTPMCMATDFWHRKYSSLCDTVINSYGVSGVYMDQACVAHRCYDPRHGHPIGGGDYWIKGVNRLTDIIREKTSGHNTVLGGEGTGEAWMTSLDLFLTLEASRERYKGIGNEKTIPLFQAIYHDYGITFGSYSSLVYPPYDDKWPKEFRPSNTETELPDDFNLQFRLEQARGFVWGTQPMIANYHSFLRKSRKAELDFLKDIVRTRHNAAAYLASGVYMHAPVIDSPEITVPVSRISIYAGRTGSTVTRGEINAPSILSGGWSDNNGNYAVALVNISDSELPVSFDFDPSITGLYGKYSVNLINADGSSPVEGLQECEGIKKVTLNLDGRRSLLVEFRFTTPLSL